jgi:hypothetical protein
MVYDRSAPDDFAVVDRWADGFGWQAHPDEPAARTSHAVRDDEGGVWLVDPLDAPGLDDRIAELGPVAGVAVLSNWHARDAGVLAGRHGVPVSIPAWMDRVPDLVDAPVERFDGADGSDGTDEAERPDETTGPAGFRVERVGPLPGWREAAAYRERDGTLYTPDLLTTARLVGDERVGLTLAARPFPPRDLLGDLEPERILVGHGHGVFADADPALADCLAGARRRLPRATVAHGPDYVAGVLGAVTD